MGMYSLIILTRSYLPYNDRCIDLLLLLLVNKTNVYLREVTISYYARVQSSSLSCLYLSLKTCAQSSP